MPRSVYPPAAVCSSWPFLSFLRRLGSLMIPACLSDVCLTPSGALCEDTSPPPACVRERRTTLTTSSRGINQSFSLSNSQEGRRRAAAVAAVVAVVVVRQGWKLKGWNAATGYTCGRPGPPLHVGSLFSSFQRRAFKSRIYFCFSSTSGYRVDRRGERASPFNWEMLCGQ